MEIQKIKCSSIEHGEIDAVIYCTKCQVYMCNKCEQFHSKLFQSHKNFVIDKEKESEDIYLLDSVKKKNIK